MSDTQPGQQQEQQPASQPTDNIQQGSQAESFQVNFDEGQGDQDPNNGNERLGNEGWLPEAYKEDEYLKGFASQEDFIKSVLENRKIQGDAIQLPGENATEEDWNKVYTKLGRPNTPEEYGLSKEMPEGVEFHEDLYNEFLTNIHSAGLSKKQAEKLYSWYNNKCAEINKGITAQIEASYKKSVDSAVEALKKEWGTDYQKNLDSAVAMANKFLSPATRQYLNASKLGNSPLLIKDFYNLSKQVSGAQMIGDGPSGSVASLAELEEKLAKNLRASDYTTNITLQQENKLIAEKIAQLQSKG